jgi:3-deoxy-D-arabino-heptulosonate 7-phosphate (DAHP) synthase
MPDSVAQQATLFVPGSEAAAPFLLHEVLTPSSVDAGDFRVDMIRIGARSAPGGALF